MSVTDPYLFNIVWGIQCCILTLFSILGCMTTCKFYSQLYCNKVPTGLNRKYQISVTACVFGSIACILTDTTRIYYALFVERDVWSLALEHNFVFADVFYYIGALSFYIVALVRLQIVFKDSIYKLSMSVIILSSVAISIYFITACIYMYGVATMTSSEQWFEDYAWSMILIIIIDFGLNATLITIFIIKIQQTIVNFQKINAFYKNDDRSLSLEFSGLTDDVLDVVTLMSILYGMAIISNALFMCFNMITAFLHFGFHDYVLLMRSIENLLNVLLLYLSYKNNRKQYFKLCGWLHHGLRFCCIKCAKKKIKAKEMTQSDATKHVAFIEISVTK